MRADAHCPRRIAVPQSEACTDGHAEPVRVTDEPLHRALGLTDDEADRSSSDPGPGAQPPRAGDVRGDVVGALLVQVVAAPPRRLPTEAPWVLVGPGEGAGVVDVGDGIAVAIRIESHNHPSAIEPYQGAATGVGGILRDIFSMGARPIALMDPLRFGPLDDPRSRWIAEGVVSRDLRLRQLGRRADRRRRGRCSTTTYAGQPARQRAVPRRAARRAARARPGRRASATSRCCSARRTGRDGIGGVSVLASAGFADDEADAAKRPSVQVGDPFEEKRLIEACLALLDAGLVGRHPGPRRRRPHVRDQRDRRQAAASAWTSTSRAVPLREPGMEPFEMMT